MTSLKPLAAALALTMPAWTLANTLEQEQTGERNTMIVINEGATDSTVIQIQHGDANFSRVEQLSTDNFARTEQLGEKNRAEIYQAEPFNNATIYQEGDDNLGQLRQLEGAESMTLSSVGDRNEVIGEQRGLAYGSVEQQGQRNRVEFTQGIVGNPSFIELRQAGQDNNLTLLHSGGSRDDIAVYQRGSRNKADLRYEEARNLLDYTQHGAQNRLQLDSSASLTSVDGLARGFRNTADLTQEGTLNVVDLDQRGAHNDMTLTQRNDLQAAHLTQVGHANRAQVQQTGLRCSRPTRSGCRARSI